MSGYTPPVCECGHVQGDHRSPGRMNAAKVPRFGGCLEPGCECQEFRLTVTGTGGANGMTSGKVNQ